MGVCIAQQLWILQMTLVSCTLLTVPISVQDFVAYSRIEIEMGHCRLIVACHGHSCARVVLESALRLCAAQRAWAGVPACMHMNYVAEILRRNNNAYSTSKAASMRPARAMTHAT